MAKDYTPESYRTLVADITGVFEGAQATSSRAVSAILVGAYWEIGRLIVEEEQKGASRADYGSRLIKRLSRDLTRRCGQGFSERNLAYMRRFYLSYRILQAPAKLPWEHYQVLSTIKDGGQRSRFEKQALECSWSSRELRWALKENRVERLFIPDGRDHSGSGLEGRLQARRGRLHTYRVLACRSGDITLDLGFNVWRTVPVKGRVLVEPGELVESIKNEAGQYSFKPSNAASGQQYTFAAEMKRVVDGDTVWTVADLGFDVRARVKLRLHDINTPELDTQKGVDAKTFVEDKLAGCDFIVVRTFGTDKYARYLADIYYLPGEESKEKVVRKGKFLNQELIDAGHAVKV